VFVDPVADIAGGALMRVSPHGGAVWSLGKALIGNALRASA
jgi:hypothetical protein